MIRTAQCSSLATARLNVSGYGLGALQEPDWVVSVHSLIERTTTASYTGPNAVSWGLLASGAIDIVLDASDCGVYDFAAVIPVIHGAGGRVARYDGQALDDGRALDFETNYAAFAVGDPRVLGPVLAGLEKAAWLSK